MNKGLKFGLIALIIYLIITPLGLFLSLSSSSILIDADVLEIPAAIMAGTFVFINNFFQGGLVQGGNVLNFSNIITFILGGLIWFGVGFLLGWLLRNKQGKKENLKTLGKILMIGSLGIFLVLALIFFLIFLSSGETDPLGIFILFLVLLGVFVPPFIIGLILWIISKFVK